MSASSSSSGGDSGGSAPHVFVMRISRGGGEPPSVSISRSQIVNSNNNNNGSGDDDNPTSLFESLAASGARRLNISDIVSMFGSGVARMPPLPPLVGPNENNNNASDDDDDDDMPPLVPADQRLASSSHRSANSNTGSNASSTSGALFRNPFRSSNPGHAAAAAAASRSSTGNSDSTSTGSRIDRIEDPSRLFSMVSRGSPSTTTTRARRISTSRDTSSASPSVSMVSRGGFSFSAGSRDPQRSSARATTIRAQQRRDPRTAAFEDMIQANRLRRLESAVLRQRQRREEDRNQRRGLPSRSTTRSGRSTTNQTGSSESTEASGDGIGILTRNGSHPRVRLTGRTLDSIRRQATESSRQAMEAASNAAAPSMAFSPPLPAALRYFRGRNPSQPDTDLAPPDEPALFRWGEDPSVSETAGAPTAGSRRVGRRPRIQFPSLGEIDGAPTAGTRRVRRSPRIHTGGAARPPSQPDTDLFPPNEPAVGDVTLFHRASREVWPFSLRESRRGGMGLSSPGGTERESTSTAFSFGTAVAPTRRSQRHRDTQRRASGSTRPSLRSDTANGPTERAAGVPDIIARSRRAAGRMTADGMAPRIAESTSPSSSFSVGTFVVPTRRSQRHRDTQRGSDGSTRPPSQPDRANGRNSLPTHMHGSQSIVGQNVIDVENAELLEALPSEWNRAIQSRRASSDTSSENRRVTRSMARSGNGTAMSEPAPSSTGNAARASSGTPSRRAAGAASRRGRTPEPTDRMTRSMTRNRRTTRAMAAQADPAALPVRKRKSPEKKTASSAKKSRTEQSPQPLSNCCICMCDSDPDEVSSIDSCSHKFCFECIKKWADRENTCPLCKEKFTEITRDRRRRGQPRSVRVEDRTQRADIRSIAGLFPHGMLARLLMSELMGGGDAAVRLRQAMGGPGGAWVSVDGRDPMPLPFFRFGAETDDNAE